MTAEYLGTRQVHNGAKQSPVSPQALHCSMFTLKAAMSS